MDNPSAISAALSAHECTRAAQLSLNEATAARDSAVAEAKEAGAGVVEIADALGLSSQQVYEILDRATDVPAVIRELRKEVIESDIDYEYLLPVDQERIDLIVQELARERGIAWEPA